MATAFDKYCRSGAYHWQQVDRSWRNARYNPLLEGRYRAVAELTPSDARHVLDIGCGDGHLLHLVHQRRPEASLHGIDPEGDGLACAREQLERHGCRAQLRQASAYHLPFEDGCLDVAYLADVIEHLENYRQAVAEACRVLRIGGILLVSTPHRQPGSKWDHLHVHEFDGCELKELLADFFGEVSVWTAWPMRWVRCWKSGRLWRESINAACRLGWNPFHRLHLEQSTDYGQLVARALKTC